MNTAISEPFLLSSYHLSQRIPKAQDGRRPEKASVYVSYNNNTSHSSGGYVTVAAQGDGVHILDLSSLHPVVSHTLGPSATFSCPAVSRHTIENGANICTTYAVVDSPSDVTKDGRGYTMRVWRENLSASLDVCQKKVSTHATHEVVKIYADEDMGSRVLLLSSKGQLTVMDVDMNIQITRNPSNDGSVLLECFVFSRKTCSFLTARTTPPHGVVAFLFLKIEDTTRLQIFAICDDQVVELGDCELNMQPNQISSISCSTSGCLSIIAQDALWQFFQLESVNGTSVNASPGPDLMRLTSLTFISSSQARRRCDEISLLSLGSSHVLLAGVSNSPTPEIVLLLWDLQYSVLLASHTLPIPSTLSYSKDTGLKLDLIAATASQALLVLSPTLVSTKSSRSSASSRSSVLVFPFSVPSFSTIANAMGHANDGLKWLATDSSSLQPTSSGIDTVHEELLHSMRAAMEQNRPVVASSAFFEWEKQETARLQSLDQAAIKHDARSINSTKGTTRTDPKTMLGYEFVKQVLDIVLQPSKPPNAPRMCDVLRYLLRKGAVSANMTEAGILETLRLHNDWKSIGLTLEHVPDISEGDLISILQCVVSHHRSGMLVTSDANAMQVDSTTLHVPPLPKFLSWCVTYKTSSVALRLAIRNHLREAEDLICLLEVIESWISTWGAKDVTLLPTKKVKNDKGDPPPLPKILLFLRVVLDASLLTLLQHPPSHGLLRKILSQLEPEVAFNDQIGQLRGPLEPFAKAQARLVREGGRRKPEIDWGTRKKQAHEQSGLAVGLYRIEELVL